MVDALDTLQFVYDAEQSFAVINASTLRNTNKKYWGAASNELQYVFFDGDAGDGDAVFSMKNKTLIEAANGDRVGMYVFSDYSGNELYAKFETEGDIHYVKVCDLDYGGWKWQEPDMSQLPAGVKLQLTALRVTRGTGILSGSGSVYLNNLSHLKNTSALTNAEAQTTVRKEVVGDQIIIYRDGVGYTVLGTEAK